MSEKVMRLVNAIVPVVFVVFLVMGILADSTFIYAICIFIFGVYTTINGLNWIIKKRFLIGYIVFFVGLYALYVSLVVIFD